MDQLIDEYIASINCNIKRITVEIEDTDICFGEIFSCERRKLSFIAFNNDFSEIFEHPTFQNDPYFTTNLPRGPPRPPTRSTENTSQEPSTSASKDESKDEADQQPKVKKSERIKNRKKLEEMEKEKCNLRKVDAAAKQEPAKEEKPGRILKRKHENAKSNDEVQDKPKKRRQTRQS